jgi:hypothetical protein
MPTTSYRRILETLDRHGVEHIVVGGVAAVLQGAPITTFDIDTLIKVDAANATKLLAALRELQARFREQPQEIAPIRDHILAERHLLLMTDSGPLDVLGFIGKKRRYQDLAALSRSLPVGALDVRVLGLATLIEEKEALGRAKDKAVIALLESALRQQNRRQTAHPAIPYAPPPGVSMTNRSPAASSTVAVAPSSSTRPSTRKT